MKTNFKIILIFSLITIMFYSCEDENDIEPKLTESKNLILEIDPKEVAKEHNKLLKKMHEQSLRSKNASMKQLVENIDIGLSNDDKEIIYNWSVSNTLEDNDKLILDFFNTELSKIYYNKIDQIITDNYSNPKLLDKKITQELKNAEIEISNELDLQILKIFGETSKASSKYWFNENGSKKLINNKKKPNETVKADGKGAASASITWAVGASLASGPVAPLTYFVAVGLGAALASIMA